jgi:hypothetical protein
MLVVFFAHFYYWREPETGRNVTNPIARQE